MRKTTLDRQAQIQRVALTLAFDVGPDRVTTGMIADKLGLTQPAIYKHFPRKDSIWQGVAGHLTERIAANITRAEQTMCSPDARLRMLVMDHLKLVQENPALPEIMVVRDKQNARTAIQTQMQTSMALFRKALVANVSAAVTEGIFRADIDAEDASALVFGIIQSLVLRMLLTRNPDILLKDGERLLNLQLSGFAHIGESR